MSLGHNPAKNKNTQSDFVVTQVTGASARFPSLQFIKTKKVPTNTTKITTSNPTILINNDDIIFDFSHVLTKENNNGNINNIKLLFKSTVKENDTLTIENGDYVNEMRTGDSNLYDVSGTVAFKSFDENNLSVTAKIISLNNISETYNVYDYRYFIDELVWSTDNTFMAERIESVNEIVNLLPSSSNLSFSSSLGLIQNNDIIELIINSVTYSFKIKEFYIDDENIEHISLYEDVPENLDLLGTPVFTRILRKRSKLKVGLTTGNISGLISNGANRLTHKDCVDAEKINIKECNNACRSLSSRSGRKKCTERCRCQNFKNLALCHSTHKPNEKISTQHCVQIFHNCKFSEWETLCKD